MIFRVFYLIILDMILYNKFVVSISVFVTSILSNQTRIYSEIKKTVWVPQNEQIKYQPVVYNLFVGRIWAPAFKGDYTKTSPDPSIGSVKILHSLWNPGPSTIDWNTRSTNKTYFEIKQLCLWISHNSKEL